MNETRYSAASKGSIFSLLWEIITEFPKANALGYRLAVRNIKARYRQSIFGLAWALFPPLATSLVWFFLKNQGVVQFKDTGVPYSVFVVTGTFLWQIFSKSIQLPIQSLKSNKSILTKIKFPRESLMSSSLYDIHLHAILSVGIVGSVMAYQGFVPGW